jgi:hypothetical protein
VREGVVVPAVDESRTRIPPPLLAFAAREGVVVVVAQNKMRKSPSTHVWSEGGGLGLLSLSCPCAQ